MKLIFSTHAWDDYMYWRPFDRKILRKINELIKEIERNPFSGKGKPEPLRGDIKGYWCRRITIEHRLVYRVMDDSIWIVSCRYHYS
jgi:toxin YoeB